MITIYDLIINRIRSMIDRLMREAAAESDQKMFCDTEMAKSRGKQKDLAARVLSLIALAARNQSFWAAWYGHLVQRNTSVVFFVKQHRAWLLFLIVLLYIVSSLPSGQ